MGLIPADRARKYKQFALAVLSGLCYLIAGLFYFDSDFPWHWRIVGIVACMLLIGAGLWLAHYFIMAN